MAFVFSSRIRFVDTDASGRIHFSALFRHLEAAEIEFFRNVGMSYTQAFETGLSLPRVHVEADYLAELVYDDEIHIEVQVEKVGQSSIILLFDVRKVEGAVLAGKGKFVMVCMDRSTGRPVPLPHGIREALAKA
jgi:YbgC/YbaW family acyl-CoA thioester hydrolase